MFQVEISDEQRKILEEKREKNIKTFMGLPYKETVEDEDFCILGVPYDTTTTGRPGARFGPRAIREFPASLAGDSQEAKAYLGNIKGMDKGNIPVMLGYTFETLQLIYEEVRQVLECGAIPIVLGGDHLITYGELRAYAQCYGPVAMIHFDSHNDTSDYGVEYVHGTPFRRAIEDGFLDASHSIQIGIRGYTDTYRNVYAAEHGMEVILARELHKIGMKAAAERIRRQVGDVPCIVTFDIDFLDPAAAPATGTPVAGGFSVHEALELLRKSLPGLDIKGFDLVEVMEDYDPGHITALAATHILTQFISVIAQNKGGKEK